MRKTFFRAKLEKTGEWIYWDMVGRITTKTGLISKLTIGHTYGEEDYYFSHQLWNKLDRGTLGQSTGMKDGFKNMIFEGDILVGPNFDDDDGYGVVKLGKGGAWEVSNDRRCDAFHNIRVAHYDVIGNIHDNAKLLETEGNEKD